MEIIEEPDPKQAARKAVRCARGPGHIVMKGDVNTDVVLRAILDRDTGLGRRGLLSYVDVFESPIQKRLMFMSDPAINIAPDLGRKVDMVRNAIWVAHRLGFARPKVAVLAAVDQVSAEDTPATADAAVIAKMGESGEFPAPTSPVPTGWTWPFPERRPSASISRGRSPAAPTSSICPDIISGNFLYKSLIHFASR